MTTRTVDSEYLKKPPGTFAVDNGNGSYSGTGGRSGGNGYVPPKSNGGNEYGNENGGGSFRADNVARSTMTFDELLNSPQGNIFKAASDDSQNNGYRAYLDNIINNGISEKETEYFFSVINKRNGN